MKSEEGSNTFYFQIKDKVFLLEKMKRTNFLWSTDLLQKVAVMSSSSSLNNKLAPNPVRLVIPITNRTFLADWY